jgi:hypothetical protein
MINFLAKSLVLVNTVFSVAAMSWAILHVLQARDFGWTEPYKEITEYDSEGKEKSWVRHASEIDKSQVALIEAKNTRDLTYVFVKPALDQIRETEPYLANNHLHYKAELKRLLDGPGELEVKNLKDGGYALDTPANDLGKPALEDKALANIKKSYKAYQTDLKKLYEEVDTVEEEIQKTAVAIKKFTADLTGTDEANKYVQPGLYQLTDLEFKAQTQLKIEIDQIKPHWSNAIENARLYQSRRSGLEDTLEKLKRKPAPPVVPTPKIEKKVI